MGHGGGRESFDNLRHLYAFDFEGESRTWGGGGSEYAKDESSTSMYIRI